MKNVPHILSWLVPSFTINRSDAIRVVLCLMAATTFWFLNALNRDYSTKISCPIQFRYNDSDYVAVSPVPEKIMLDVTGYGWNLLKRSLGIDKEPVEYVITRPLRTKYVTAPFLLASVSEQIKGLRVNYVVEDTLYLDFDQRVRKTVPIVLDSALIDLESGYAIVSPVQLEPRKVTFEGPASMLKKLPSTLKVTVPTRRIDDSFEEDIKLDYQQDPLVEVDHPAISVSFAVEKLATGTLNVAIHKVNFPDNKKYVLTEQEVELTYLVRKINKKEILPADFNIIADFKAMREDSTIVLYVEKKPSFIRNVMLTDPYIKVQYAKP